MTVVTTAEAKVEIDEAFDYYEGESPGLGLEFFQELNLAIGRIVNFPNAWHPLSSNTRRHMLQRFPYAVIYRQHVDAILVTSVVHLKRNRR